MVRRRTSIPMAAVVLLFLASPAWLVSATEPEPGGGVPLPAIPKGQGEACVAETPIMRRNHMTLLKHQRDETMRQGIRGNPYSIEECIACHAVQGPDGMALTVDSPQHFCRACHDYAAVSIDCFECHASRPESGVVTGGPGVADAASTTGVAVE